MGPMGTEPHTPTSVAPPKAVLPFAMSGVGHLRPKERRWRRIFWAAFPHGCLIISVVVYSLLGALMFTQIEGTVLPRTEEFGKFLGQLWNISQDTCSSEGNSSLRQTFIEEASKLMTHFKIEWTKNPQGQWSFLGSLFFCCTVFTTVGYGHISPVTNGGKFACIAYAAVGIPLMLLLLADLGDLLAAILSKCYGTAKKVCARNIAHKKPSNFSTRFSSYRTTTKKLKTSKSQLARPLTPRVVITEPSNITTEVLKSQPTFIKKSAFLRNIEIFEMIIEKERLKVLTIQDLKLQRCRSCPEIDKMPQLRHVLDDFDKIGKELNKLNVPIILIAFIVVAYTLCGASILLIWEKEWDYVDAFYFCFITLTTIGFGDIFPNHPNYFLGLSVYTVIGMAIMVMAFKLGQDRLVGCYKQSISCISGGKARKYSKH